MSKGGVLMEGFKKIIFLILTIPAFVMFIVTAAVYYIAFK